MISSVSNVLFPEGFGLATVVTYLVLGAVIYRILFGNTKKDWQTERNESYHPRVASQKRRVRTYLGYPNGWYKVANVYDMKPGQIISLTLCGKDVVVFKPEKSTKHTEDTAFLIDAYCPHLGSHLGDGKVCGDCIECPFHGWLFNGDGVCQSIPYSPAPPPKEAAMATRWHTRIQNGMLLAWYDADGNEPEYEPHRVPELDDRKKYRYMGEVSGQVSMHIQDFVENGADYAHFEKLHGVMLELPFLGVIFGVKHNVSWEQVPQKKHQSLFKNFAMVTFRGTPMAFTAAQANILIDGPGGQMHFHFETPLGDVHIIQTSTPIAPCLNKYSMIMFSEHTVPRLLAWYICKNWRTQAVMDFIVWENKEYTAKPVLVKGDGPVMQMRRWYSQFYSESASQVGALQTQDLLW